MFTELDNKTLQHGFEKQPSKIFHNADNAMKNNTVLKSYGARGSTVG